MVAQPAVDFWAVWEEHRSHLFAVCLRAMNRNRADAEDALGQLMLKARDKLSGCALRIVDMRAWLTRLACNECIDIHRKRKRGQHLAQRWDELDRIEKSAGSPSTETSVELELQPHLAAAIERLPERLREPFVLRCVEKLSYREIASRLSRHADCVRKQVQQACTRLRSEMVEAPTAPREVKNPGKNPGGARAGSGRQPEPELAIFAPALAMRRVEIRRPDGESVSVVLFLPVRPGRERQKIATLRTYLQRHPRGWRFRLKLASLLYYTGEWDEAIEAHREVLLRRPWLLGATLQLGNMLRLRDQRQEAAAVFTQALLSTHEVDETHLLVGLTVWMCGDHAGATVALRAAADAASEPRTALHALADCQFEAGERQQALATADEALALDPQDLVALAQRATGVAEAR